MLSVVPKNGPDGRLQLHASTIVISNQAVAFVGPSGSGKSGHALEMVARGARLLADDITWFEAKETAIMASCPPSLSGQIEARGLGILNAEPAPPAPLSLIVDLGTPEQDRLPPRRTTQILQQSIPLLHKSDTPHFIASIIHYIAHGRIG